MTPPTPISRDEPELVLLDEFVYCYVPMEKWAEAKEVLDNLVSQEVAEARRDELEMAILMKGKSLVRGGIIDTSSLEGGQPNMIDARILEARLASLSDPEVTEKNLGNPSSGKAAPLPKPKQ